MSLWHEILFKPLFNALIFLYNIIPGHDMGVAIIVLTIIIRLILYPWQNKALISQKKIQELQPELKKLQEKYKGDRQKLAKAQLELYQKTRVNPLSSCLPTLIQFPFLIALYQVFRLGLKTASLSEVYSFIPRPLTLDPTLFGLIDLSSPDRYFLPIIAGITQFIQTRMLMPKTPKNPKTKASFQDIFSQQMVYIFPIMIVIFSMSLPAALPLYWIITAVFSIFQQYLINTGRIGSSKKVKVKIRSK